MSAKENYSQLVSAASFEWLVNMSMCEQWSCLTSAVLMKQLQMEKRALEGLGRLSTKFQMRDLVSLHKGILNTRDLFPRRCKPLASLFFVTGH